MTYQVTVKIPGEAAKLVGQFDTVDEAKRCKEFWAADRRIKRQVVSITEVKS